MRTIAIEEHFLANGFREKGASMIAQIKAVSNTISAAFINLSDLGAIRLKDMDANGIDLQVISHTVLNLPISASESLRLVQEANDQLAAAVVAYPDRFAGFATLPMADPKAAANELERAVRSLGFKGALISGTEGTGGRFLDDPSFLPVFERAVTLNVPIYLHPSYPPTPVREAYYTGFDPAVNFSLSTASWGWHSEVGLHTLRLILAGVFDRLPALQIIIGHMGEMIPFMLDRINDWLAPLTKHLQRKVPEYFQQNFYITTAGFFTNPPLLLCLQTIGADRIIFAVDYPFSKNEQGRKFLDSASISLADKAKISHLNAERLLGLSEA